MSYAVAKDSSPVGRDGPPSSATVYDFICLFTHDLRRKQKRWQDGKLKYHSFNKKIMVYDDHGHFVGDSHWDQEGDLAQGDEFSLDRGMALVQVEVCTGEKQQDLTELLDKRAREVEKRRQVAAAKAPRATPRGSLAGRGAQPQAAPQHRPHLPLSSLVQSPGHIGRAAIPAHSPFEARQQQRLHQKQPATTDAQPTVAAPARKRRASPSPPSKAGFARNLFGTTLNLSSSPGPELLAARARALRQRMQSQSTPQQDEEGDAEEQMPVQSSPFFEQDGTEKTPSRPAKEQRAAVQPVARPPIATARSVMREAEEAGNRHLGTATDDEGTRLQKATKKKVKEVRKPQRQAVAVGHTAEDTRHEEQPTILEKSPQKNQSKEIPQSRQPEDPPPKKPEKKKKQLAATRHSPTPDLMIIDEPDEAPISRKAPKELQRKMKQRDKIAEVQPVAAQEEPKPKEPRTTLRMRSRQKRGLLMMQEPIVPVPKPPAAVEEQASDRIAKTLSPEPQRTRSASPEQVTIPSSVPPAEDLETAPVERVPTPALAEPSSEDDLPPLSRCRTKKRRTYSETAPAERQPTPALAEPSSDDDLPPLSRRRAKKRRTYSPPPEPDCEEAPKGKRQRRKATKEDKASEEEEEPRPRKRQAATRSASNKEAESAHEETKEVTEVQGPRIAKLPRKGIRSREILGYVFPGIEALIPSPFASASFRLGGPPVPAVRSEVPPEPAKVDAAPRKPARASSLAPDSAAPLPIEELFAVEPAVAGETAVALPEETVAAATDPQEPILPEAISVVPEVAEEIPKQFVSRRNVALQAHAPVVRSNSANDAVAPTTTEPNETKLESLSAPEVALAELSALSNAPVESAITCGPTQKLATPEAPVALAEIPAPSDAPLEDATLYEPDQKSAACEAPAAALLPLEGTSSGSETNPAAGRPRIVNPASRGRKAARREDAAGLAPQVMVPLEPVQPVAARMVSARPGGGGRRGRIAAAGPLALGPVGAPLPSAAGVPIVAMKAATWPHLFRQSSKFANLDFYSSTTSFQSYAMSASALPQGFSIFQPTLGAQLQFFPAVGTQELDELIHAHLVGPASSQEKRATVALDFLDYAQRTGQTFKFYAVYPVAASPATSASSSFHTSPATASWDWSQTSRTASVSSRSSQHRVSKPASPASRVRTTDFASIPGMQIMTKDGVDVTNSASRGSKTKEQRDHAHLMRIIKACDSCKRKKIRCDPSHKKRAAPTAVAPAATTAKVTKKARTSSPSVASQSISPPQSVSPQSISPPVLMEEFGSFAASPFDMDASFSFDALDAFDPTLTAPADLWDEFVQYPPIGQAEDYDFFADPESLLSSQSSDADLSAARISVSASPPGSGAPPGRGPDIGRAESHTELPDGVALATTESVSAQLPYELHDSAGDYTDFNLFSPGSSFSEDELMLDIGSSTSSLSTRDIPSPTDSPRRPPNVGSPDIGDEVVNHRHATGQSPFTRAEETEPSGRTNVRDMAASGIAGALSVLSRSDVVMSTNDQGQLIICCPPGTVVVNISGQGSVDAGLVNVSTVNDPSSSSLYIPRELSELAVASVSAGTGDVDATVTTWLDHGSGGHPDQLAVPLAMSAQSSPTLLLDTLQDGLPSRFIHRNTEVAQSQTVVRATAATPGTAVTNNGPAGSTGHATGFATGMLSTPASTSRLAVGLDSPASVWSHGLVNTPAASESSSTPSLSVSYTDSSSTASPSLVTSPVDILGGYVSNESGSVSSVHSDVPDRGSREIVDSSVSALPDGESPSDAAHELSHISLSASDLDKSLGSLNAGKQPASELDDKPFIYESSSDESTSDESTSDESSSDESSSDNNELVSSVVSMVETSKSRVALFAGRPVQYAEPAFDVSPTAVSTSPLPDATSVGRSLSSLDAPSPITPSELAVMIQTALTGTLLAAAYAQSVASLQPQSIHSRACREYMQRGRRAVAPSMRVSAVC
ncbi:hypothetical protein A9K55_008879 [Cordyceps militaris]|uniref:5'-3' DNA helicase ZGRF1-like N-terminal domain-containing protein n=1 Tax=Cordyceps militaris TaxID=73501 RepID=A0A2H4SJ68_CORMI|nr:hypothetical protein A9K55_008879 [Cordyceps militaris]